MSAVRARCRAPASVILPVAVTLLWSAAAPAQTARYARTESVAGEPVVADSATGLVWQGCASGLSGTSCATGSLSTLTWSAALAYCEALAWGGQTDWRLPDIKELASLADSRRSNPALDPTAFPATPTVSWHWSATTRADAPSSAPFVDFSDGHVAFGAKASAAHVRCVRVGP